MTSTFQDKDPGKAPAARPSLRVFVSAGADVVEERQLVREVADELNRDPLLHDAPKLEIASWANSPTHLPLSVTLTPQEAIKRGFYRPSECDVLIVILWSRMGTPLPDDFHKANGTRYLSGIEWEYEDAYNATPRPDIVVFRRTEEVRIALSDHQSREVQFAQLDLVDQFFARFIAPEGRFSGGFYVYVSPLQFRAQLRDVLVALALEHGNAVKKIESSTRAVVSPGPASTIRKSVFISYSHADAVWLERLKIHLAPLVRHKLIDYWEDTRIKPGSDWRETINIAIVKTKVAVLLLSADFLASEFIISNELPPLLEAAQQDGAVILPVIVSPCRFLKIASLSRFQSVNSPSQPLIGMSRAESEATLVKLTDAVEDAIS